MVEKSKVNTEELLEQLLAIAKEKFNAKRYETLVPLYNDFRERILIAPASGVVSYHNAFAGGYLVHIHNVIKNSYKVASLFKHNQGVIDFSEEEMVFTAMHHDLGKLGDKQFSYYMPNDSKWHVENRGEIYKINPEIQYMRVTERSLCLLQEYGVRVSQKEWLGIRLSDGIYDESNKPYYLTLFGSRSIRTNLHYIIHWADHISAQAEKDQFKKDENIYDITPKSEQPE